MQEKVWCFNMYDIEIVSKKLSEEGIVPYQVEIPFDIVNEAIWFLDYDEFIKFILSQDNKNVFIYEKLIDLEDYLIGEETFRNLHIKESAYEYLLDMIKSYNESLLDEEPPFPECIFIIYLWNNQKFCIPLQNSILFNGEPLLTAEEKLQEMIMDNQDEIAEDLEAKQHELEKQLKQLETEILEDAEFQRCTNVRLRRNYMYGYLRDNCKYDLIKQLWTHHDGLVYHDAFDFIEKLWRKYKGK